MRHPPSLALRLTLLFGIAAAIVFSGFGWIIERSIEHHFSTEDAAELEVIARAASQVLSTQRTVVDPTVLKQRFSDLLVGHHSAILNVFDQDGRNLFVSPNGPDFSTIIATIPANNERGSMHLWSDDKHTYRILTRQLGDESTNDSRYTLSVGVAIDYHLRFLESFRLTLWLMVASGIIMMGLMGWIAVHLGHAPLHNIVAQIRRISASELNTRLAPETVPRELTDLATSFNALLENMEEAFHRLSNYSADIAHELRTPVTNLLTQTQVSLTQSRTNDEYREILFSNIEEYERMAQMISDMLFIAKADNGLYEPAAIELDLGREILDLFDYYEAWAEERGVSLALEGSASVRGDKLMLRRALGNLLSNAIRHTPAGNLVRVLLKQLLDNSVSIIVENPGQVIACEHIPRLFDRFYRVDASRQRGGEGAGLGLAITKSIVDIHGGTISANSTAAGTQFCIKLPGLPLPGNR